jgi:hypothetical protein
MVTPRALNITAPPVDPAVTYGRGRRPRTLDGENIAPSHRTQLQPGRVSGPRLEREKGFEPSTSTLARWHSTAELLPRRARVVYRSLRKLSRTTAVGPVVRWRFVY